jgi:hypothetical protein
MTAKTIWWSFPTDEAGQITNLASTGVKHYTTVTSAYKLTSAIKHYWIIFKLSTSSRLSMIGNFNQLH